MQFLHAVGKLPARRAKVHIAQPFQLGIHAPGQQHDAHTELPRGMDRANHVPAGATGGQGHQTVAAAPMCLQVAREHFFIGQVVAHATHVTDIADSDSGQRRAVQPIAPGELFGKVHGIAHGAAVAAGKNPASLRQRITEQVGSRGNFLLVGLIRDQGFQRQLRLAQTAFHKFNHRFLLHVRRSTAEPSVRLVRHA